MKKHHSPMPLRSGRPLYWWIVSVVLLVCFSALHAQTHAPATVLLTGSREIKIGDKGFIAWRFQGYESVQVVGDTVSVIRGARDMITISPAKTTTYRLTALKQGGSRLDTVWRVVVLTQKQADSIAGNEEKSAGAKTMSAKSVSDREVSRPANELPPSVFATAESSNKPSEYYAGISHPEDNSKGWQGLKIKIVRIPDNSVEGAYLHAVVLDTLGNFLPTLHTLNTAFKLTLTGKPDESTRTNPSGNAVSCDVPPPAFPQLALREASLYDSPDLAVTLCVDNANYMQKVVSATATLYEDFMRSLGNRVEKNQIVFDHRIMMNPAVQPTKESGGLTALYKAAYKGILTLKQSGRRHKALVLVSGGKDDASILYTMHDVMRSAREFGVVVYAIAVGSNADTYALRMMAEYSGGRFYAVDDGTSDEFQKVLKEIALSYKAFYEITLSGGTSVQAHSKVIDATLSFAVENKGILVSETKPFAMSEQAYYSAHQIVATFAANSFQADEQYDAQIGALALALKDNPTKVIELVGHTDMQGNDGTNRSFALRRAQAVKSRLTAMGAHPAQIRLRSAGREKPVYYFESEEWQSRVNRRVELRWLDPALVPFEILAQAVASEEEAMRLEAEWSTRGYDAYYDAFLVNRIPAYRLKLWGFPTLESAVKTKDELQAKYRLLLKVQ
jgi:hypothetical protein